MFNLMVIVIIQQIPLFFEAPCTSLQRFVGLRPNLQRFVGLRPTKRHQTLPQPNGGRTTSGRTQAQKSRAPSIDTDGTCL